MNLTNSDIGEFRKLYEQETGKQIDDETTQKEAMNLLHLVAFAVLPKMPSSP